jgi:hypothetical protein
VVLQAGIIDSPTAVGDGVLMMGTIDPTAAAAGGKGVSE